MRWLRWWMAGWTHGNFYWFRSLLACWVLMALMCVAVFWLGYGLLLLPVNWQAVGDAVRWILPPV